MKVAVSWSAGKDACLAWRRACEAGATPATFLTMCSDDGRTLSHQVPPGLVRAQADAAGVVWLPVNVPVGGYAKAFDQALQALCASGHTHVVFGDIDLQAHRDWLEPACARAGLQAWFPLWGTPRDQLAQQVLASGIQSRLVCVDTRWLDESYCGAEYDAALLARLPADVCPCGEGGEFHTFVWNAPGFARPLRIDLGPVRRVPSQPPLSTTELVYRTPVLA